MPRYHFHLEASDGVSGDVEGSELPDDSFAVSEATRAAGQTMTDELASGAVSSNVVVRLELSDETVVAVIRVKASVELSR